MIFEFRLVFGLVIGGVEIVDARLQTGIHDRQILIRQSKVHNMGRASFCDQFDHRGHFFGVNFVGRNGLAGALQHAFSDRIAF